MNVGEYREVLHEDIALAATANMSNMQLLQKQYPHVIHL